MPENNSSKFSTILGWSVAAAILAAIVAGMIMVGSPGKARDLKIDAKRLGNMKATARVISCYADKTGDLPSTLAPIENAVSTMRYDSKTRRCQRLAWVKDPVSDANFEYKRLGKKSFELCGVFEREGQPETGRTSNIYNSYDANVLLKTNVSRQNSGRHCYTAEDWK